jgi:signal-transduction protein with cAMP-binding, CBS, and nucleotidyltransferase domain
MTRVSAKGVLIMIVSDMPLLQQSPYFRDLRPEDLALVQRHAHRRDLTIGEIILLEGQPTEALYLVVGGRVRIFLSTTEGREQVLFVAGPGAAFNEAAAFDGGTNLANAQAMDPDTCICVVPVSVLAQLLAAGRSATSSKQVRSRARIPVPCASTPECSTRSPILPHARTMSRPADAYIPGRLGCALSIGIER